ncbi:phosphotransferase [Symbioplanes lichenis]|uniref:phosphotransferase n=1 Tax=Symbioplanes lichenis TaxID=1629072 RepID=UPI0027389FA2|nr:phosphotransferase [Actinoplanes lichenis]
MLTPPASLPAALLADRFGLHALEYVPVGWGSHHWTSVDAAGVRWFVTADLASARRERALAAAAALDLDFVVAPAAGPEPITDEWMATLYPYLSGESFHFGEWPSAGHRDAVRDMLARLHTAPVPAAAARDDLVIEHRDALAGGFVTAGPYTDRAAALITDHAAVIRALLGRYDDLVAGADRSRDVLTHGEPHPGNTMRTATGWKLIDWETALVAPPERDLWLLGGEHSAWSAATGMTVVPAMLILYRLRWIINDLCVDLHRFRRPHAGTVEDAESWKLLHRNMVAGVPEALEFTDG